MTIHLEWGLSGAQAHGDQAQVAIVVDVLSFSTCVDVACANGAAVVPFPFGDREAAAAEAQRLGAVLAGRRRDANTQYSLSAATLSDIPSGTRLVLPSPNGSRITYELSGKPVLAGCLRNAQAVARAAMEIAGDGTILVIPAGERWRDGSLRPALEDLLGAGAILSELDGARTPEATMAQAAFENLRGDLAGALRGCVSGLELSEMGFPQDVEMALALNVSTCVPKLADGAYWDRGAVPMKPPHPSGV